VTDCNDLLRGNSQDGKKLSTAPQRGMPWLAGQYSYYSNTARHAAPRGIVRAVNYGKFFGTDVIFLTVSECTVDYVSSADSQTLC